MYGAAAPPAHPAQESKETPRTMATPSAEAMIGQLTQILAADQEAGSAERRKFPAAFRTELETALANLQNAQQAIPLSESDRRAASDALKAARQAAPDWVRTVHARIHALPPGVDKAPVLAAYGFQADGDIGRLDNERTLALLALFPVVSARLSATPDAQIPPDQLVSIADIRARILANIPRAEVGDRAGRTRTRDDARVVADDLISRVLGYLIWALPQRDRDPRMHDYGFVPRQAPASAARRAATETGTDAAKTTAPP